jgi:hypothetical protein
MHTYIKVIDLVFNRLVYGELLWFFKWIDKIGCPKLNLKNTQVSLDDIILEKSTRV